MSTINPPPPPIPVAAPQPTRPPDAPAYAQPYRPVPPRLRLVIFVILAVAFVTFMLPLMLDMSLGQMWQALFS